MRVVPLWSPTGPVWTDCCGATMLVPPMLVPSPRRAGYGSAKTILCRFGSMTPMLVTFICLVGRAAWGPLAAGL
jgi:hypothetical protein